ncbi:MAG TPA: hypothetical protein VI612_01560 [Candidatus Nanoarchaeia archaeon]|nr:hypothetical protein [Candidatus Nanoarchaeia archaeon]
MGELYLELLQQAKKQMHLADHMVYVTFPLVQETKFLLAILGHLTNATRCALRALLEYEFLYKRIEAYNKTITGEISIYKNHIEKRYNFDGKYFRLLQKLTDLEKFEKESPVRFKRGDKYILSTGEYKMSVLDVNTVKRYSELAKKFVSEVNSILTKVENVRAI